MDDLKTKKLEANDRLLEEIHEELVERENNRGCYSDFELIEKIENEKH